MTVTLRSSAEHVFAPTEPTCARRLHQASAVWRTKLPALLTLVGVLLATAGASATEAPAPVAGKSGDKVTISKTQLAQVSIAKVEMCHFRSLRPAIGQIAFNEEASTVVLSPFSGRVTKLIAKVGDEVNRGDPLFELESPEVVQAQTDLIAAVQGVGKAKSQLNLANRSLERQNGLIAAKATSVRDLDQAKNDFAQAESDVTTAEGALTAARNRLRVLIGRSKDEVARVEKERIINPTITVNAPIDGTVISRKIGPGQYVRTDSNESLFNIANLSTMWLKAAVPENDIAHIRTGQEVEVKVLALPGRTFRARIAGIGASSDSTTRRVIVRSELPNPDQALKAEMFATFKIVTGAGESYPGVPTEAVIWDGDIATVWVETDPLVFQRRKVKPGPEQDGLIQIRDGLKAGEKVAARGAIFIDNEWRQ